MNVQEIRDLDFNDLGAASSSAKIFLIVMIVAVILVIGYFSIINNQRTQLQTHEREETELRTEFATKQRKAASLNDYEQQLDEMREVLRTLLRQLPSKTEMPDLLVDISQTALASGIETELFEPNTETLQGFYAEQPISIRMTGQYHQFGNFVGGVASLTRVVILTMRDISLEPIDDQPGVLRMEGTVTTYRYLDDSEDSDLLLEGES